VKRCIAVSAFLAICLVAFAADRDVSQTRVLTGQVTNRSDTPLPQAIVYLKNTKTLTVRTFITDDKGNYRFPELSPDVDYQIYAEFSGARSETRTLSSFDSRPHAVINLKVAEKK
jgi:Carboxypeptidase regulatory-like domain